MLTYDTPSVRARFDSKIDRNGPNGCWLWTAGRDKDGYGNFSVGYRNGRAHRFSWELANGQRVPAGLQVLHTCDNPPCVNPAHLWLGTHADNHADLDAKGRRPRGDTHPSRLHPERIVRGEQSGTAKLTTADVLEIRRLWAAGGMSHSEIAARFGVNKATSKDITKRRTWAHVA